METNLQKIEIPIKHYFTFGASSEHFKHYVLIEGAMNDARTVMFSIFGTKWAFQYSEKNWNKDNLELLYHIKVSK